VNTQNIYFITAVAIFLAVNLCVAGYFYFRSRRSSKASWEDLLAQLTWTDRNNISQVALDLVDEAGSPKPPGESMTLEPSALWGLVGGLEGLQILEKNSDVLIDLAFYMQQWYPEALVTAERLRLDARELKWHVARLKGAAETGNLQVSFPFYAQRAVVAYYVMTRRVLSLYEAGNFDMLADLQSAL
jgi:hypothetical protein